MLSKYLKRVHARVGEACIEKARSALIVRWAALLALYAAGGACSGAVSPQLGPSTDESATAPGAGDGATVPGAPDPPGMGAIASSSAASRFQCSQPELRGAGRRAMRRLTRDELLQSLAAVVGLPVIQLAAVQQAAAQIPPETSGDLVEEFQNGHAFDHVQGLLMTAEAVAEAVASDGAARQHVFGPCASQSADVACATAFLRATGRRLLKRPLSEETLRAWLADFTAQGAGIEGLKGLLARVLQAPEVVFHLEPVDTSVPASSVGKRLVDDWAVAARLAYALTGQGPDEALLDAAALGQLRTKEQVRPHAHRLLQTPQARRQLEGVLDAWLHLRDVPTPNPTVSALADINPSGLAEEARQELLDFATHLVLQKNADSKTLLSARIGFPRSARMAKLYGSAMVQTDQPVTLNQGHGGLLLRIAPLLSGQTASSPILRGVYVRKRLLCDAMPSPDFSIITARAEALAASNPATMSTREIVENITSPPTCMTCHERINPIGYSLEGFDPLGQRRSTEIAYDSRDQEVGRHAIDVRVEDAALEPGAPALLTNSDDLLGAIADGGKVRACIAQRLYTHAQLRPALPEDNCALSEVESLLREGKSIKEAWLLAIVNEELFLGAVEDAK